MKKSGFWEFIWDELTSIGILLGWIIDWIIDIFADLD